MGILPHTYVNLFVLLRILCLANGLQREKRGSCPQDIPSIANGDYDINWQGVVKYSCKSGFQLYGVETIACLGSKWSGEPPICIANTCTKIASTSALRIKQELNGALLRFSCCALHKLEGSSKLLCIGSKWTDKPPTCQPWDPHIACDLETPDLCGWSHDELGDQEWRWHTGSTSTAETGPSYDHSLGLNGNGHYVYFETSSPVQKSHKAMLNSPLYTPEYSEGKCFNFWYHIYGTDEIGDLELFFKPDGYNITALKPSFLVNQNLGDVWNFANVPVAHQTTDFQIVFVATRATSYRSDFALDDFSLGDCKDTLGPVQNTSVAVTTQLPNRQQTTTPATARTTFRKTTITKVTTAQPTTLKTTQAPPPPTTSVKPEITTFKRTKTSTTTATTKSTTIMTTATTTTATTVAITATEPITFKTSTSVNLLSTTKIGEENTTSQKSENNSLKPVVNPNLPVKKTNNRTVVDSDESSKIVYIVIGFASFIAVASLVWVSIYCYRRQRSKRELLQTVSLCHSNVLYNVMSWDDTAVSFTRY